MKTKLEKLLIESWKFDWVNPSITSDIFPQQEIRGDDYKLFHFDKNISSEDAIKEMESEGFSPANIYELLSWKDWNEKGFVVALGSVGKVRGCRCVPCLFGSDSERSLRLAWWDGAWSARYRFLGVRNSSLGTLEPKKTALEPLESLTLPRTFGPDTTEGRLRSLEADMESLKKVINIKTGNHKN